MALIEKWKECIQNTKAKLIASLVDDIIAIDKLTSDAKFIKTFDIDYEEEGK